MDYILELEQLFNCGDIVFEERVKVVECSFNIPKENIPSFDAMCENIEKISPRDMVTFFFECDSGDNYIFNSLNYLDEIAYRMFYQDTQLGDEVKVKVKIEKTIADNRLSVYNFKSFSTDLVALSDIQVLKTFSGLLEREDFLIFEVLNEDVLFKTKTMLFCSAERELVLDFFDRKNQINKVRELSYFANLSEYSLLPDDFHIEVDFIGNVLTKLFEKIDTILSLIYISSSCEISQNVLRGRITGQRNIEYCYQLKMITRNIELVRIYNWIYTEGNSTDKVLLARNLLSLHCKYSEVIDIDEKTFASIQSNYNLYLKENIEKYLELKSKLAEFISEIVAKTGDYSLEILDKFKGNLIAIFAFLLTIVLTDIISNTQAEHFFSKEITIILEIVLIGSAVYLWLCRKEIKYKKKKVELSYNLLKKNYNSILAQEDINEAFQDDKLIKEVTEAVDKEIFRYSAIWSTCLLALIIIVEYNSCNPIIAPKLMWLLDFFCICK